MSNIRLLRDCSTIFCPIIIHVADWLMIYQSQIMVVLHSIAYSLMIVHVWDYKESHNIKTMNNTMHNNYQCAMIITNVCRGLNECVCMTCTKRQIHIASYMLKAYPLRDSLGGRHYYIAKQIAFWSLVWEAIHKPLESYETRCHFFRTNLSSGQSLFLTKGQHDIF